jgi:4-amino-4-deoxy-L-arabinose transferase-like glycosyltransferase
MALGDRKAKLLFLLLGISLVHGLIYSAVIPPWQSPDEPRHFEYVSLLCEKRRLITEKDVSPPLQRAIIASMQEHNFWQFGRGFFNPQKPPQSFADIWGAGGPTTLLHRSPLYYLLGLPFFALVAGKDLVTQLYTLRLLSVILGMLTVLIAWCTARELFPDDDFMRIGVPAFIALLPMFAFMAGSVNSDNLANLVVSLLLLLLVIVFRRGLSWPRALGILVLVAVGLATKRTTTSVIPLLLAAIPLLYVGMREEKQEKALQVSRLGLGLAAGVVILAIVALVVGKSGLLGGETLKNMERTLSRYLFNYPGQLQAILTQLSSLTVSTLFSSLQRLFTSFWAEFGWLKVRLAPLWYQVLAGVCLAALGGIFLLTFRLVRRPELLESWQKRCLLLFALYILIVAAAPVIFFSAYLATQWEAPPQGRYVFLGIVPIAILLMLGLREPVPVRYRPSFLVLCLVAMVFFDFLCLTRYVIPYFYG